MSFDLNTLKEIKLSRSQAYFLLKALRAPENWNHEHGVSDLPIAYAEDLRLGIQISENLETGALKISVWTPEDQ